MVIRLAWTSRLIPQLGIDVYGTPIQKCLRRNGLSKRVVGIRPLKGLSEAGHYLPGSIALFLGLPFLIEHGNGETGQHGDHQTKRREGPSVPRQEFARAVNHGWRPGMNGQPFRIPMDFGCESLYGGISALGLFGQGRHHYGIQVAFKLAAQSGDRRGFGWRRITVLLGYQIGDRWQLSSPPILFFRFFLESKTVAGP